MKKILLFFAFAALICSAVSCKILGDNNPPYYQVLARGRIIDTNLEKSDFSAIFSVSDSYINNRYNSEKEAVSVYRNILSKTKDAHYSAPNGSYVKLVIVKYVAKKESENVVSYSEDPNYKSPYSHIWDGESSRDL